MFYPTISVNSVIDIKLETLKKYNIKALLLDIDNTLSLHGAPIPYEGVMNWLSDIKSEGIKVMIISNNKSERVKSFSQAIGLDYISNAKKPFYSGFNKAINILNVNKKDILVVGDQIFTDILGANLCGMKSALVRPKDKNEPISIIIRRFFEIPFRIIIEYRNKKG